MQLKLIPQHTESTIHFSFSFGDLPENLCTPAAWIAQLTQLHVEDLEVPATVHSFDKAVALTTLLDEVVFDLQLGEIQCHFADGFREVWSFYRFGGAELEGSKESEARRRDGQKLITILEGIVRDVREGALEDERILLRRQKERQRAVGLERSKSVTSKSQNKSSKHKKNRSVFMQIVSSIGSSLASFTSSSSSGPSLPSHRFSPSMSNFSAYSTPENDLPPEMAARSRVLRRAARSALIDAFRRFVLTELTRRIPAFSYKDVSEQFSGAYGGGFCVWVNYSMRHRIQGRIDELLEEAEAERIKRQDLAPLSIPFVDGRSIQWAPEPGRSKDGFDRSTTTMVPLSFSDDEDDTETETDGSSVHTPSSSSHIAYFPVRPSTSASSHSQASLSSQIYAKELDSPPLTPTTPSPPSSPTTPTSFQSESLTPTHPILQSRSTSLSQNLTGSALAEYKLLVEQRDRLWKLAMFTESQARNKADDIRSRLEVLAVLSKRRAWSNGTLKGQTSAMDRYGLAMPFKSSPLARYSWTAEDLQKEQDKAKASRQNGVMVSTSISVTTFPAYGNAEDDGFECDPGSYLPMDKRPHIEQDFEIYEEFPGPSPLDTRGGYRRRRNHVRGKNEFGMATTPGLGRLFPVSEELEGEGEEAVDLEFRVALGGSSRYGAIRGKRKDRGLSALMDCGEENGDREEIPTPHNPFARFDEDEGLEDPRDIDLELGFGGFDFNQQPSAGDFIVHGDDDHLFDDDEEEDEDDEDEDEDEFKFDMSNRLERPKIRPRVRTSSIFVRKEDSSELSNASSNILCQPVKFVGSTSPPNVSSLSNSISPPRRALEIDVSITGFRTMDGKYASIDLKSPTKPLPSIPTMDLEVHQAPEEFTLAMDLPRSVGAGKKSKLLALPLGRVHSRPKLSSLFEEAAEVVIIS